MRTVTSIIVLTAFILGVSYIVKGVSTLSIGELSDKTYKLFRPVLEKAGVEEQVGVVAGIFTRRFGDISTDKTDKGSNNTNDTTKNDLSSTKDQESANGVSSKSSQNSGNVKKVSIMSDSHNYNGLLNQALIKTKDMGIDTVFYLGDFTDWGDTGSLQNSKEVMDSSGLTYYALPGDHDLAQSVGTSNFIRVFGKTYQEVEYGGYSFVLLDNSANFTTLSEEQMDWFKITVSDADFVLVHQALFSKDNDRIMGIVDGDTVTKVKAQADEILTLIRNSDVKAIISGDRHQFSNVRDPVKESLSHIVIGALSEGRNMQTPRFAVLEIDESGSFEVKEIVLE